MRGGRFDGKSARIANPAQTTAFFRVKKGFLSVAVDEENPFMIAAGIGTILI